MAETMMRFSQQRALGLLLFVVFSAAIVWTYQNFAAEIRGMSYLTGWALFGVMILLTVYNGRKKIPFLPVLSSESWLQFHIYAGLLTGTLFLVHVAFRVPTGGFQMVLTWLYVLVMVSGFAGLFISREIPRRLTARGGEVLFERIPSIRVQLREQGQKLALESVGQFKATTIADFYVRELSDFFDAAKNQVAHLMQRRAPLNQLLGKISDVNRYLNNEERATMDKISTLVQEKDGLDYHHAHQMLLKIWLFVHIPLTYSLMLFVLVHIALVFAFSGGTR